MEQFPFVLIDPGHGGKDPGAVANGMEEAEVNLHVAQCLKGILDLLNFPVFMTRQTDRFVSLQDRVDIEKRLIPDLFISLHCNASENEKAEGIEIYTSVGITKADHIATKILESIQQAFPKRKYRTDFSDGFPDKEANFYVLTKTRCPAVLLEMGFLTNPEEARWLSRMETRWEMARAIVTGLMQVF